MQEEQDNKVVDTDVTTNEDGQVVATATREDGTVGVGVDQEGIYPADERDAVGDAVEDSE